MRRAQILTAAALLVAGCPSEGDDPVEVPPPVDAGYTSCAMEDDLGGFTVEPADGFTTIVGSVQDGVTPSTVMDVLDTSGDCVLLHPRTLFCDPACAAGTVCDGTECIDAPRNVDIGPASIDGLAAPVDLEATPPTMVYSFRGDLPFPAFGVGDRVELYTGVDRGGASVLAYGVEDLEVLDETILLEPGFGAALAWTSDTSAVDDRIEIEVNIANHGGVPALIRCTAEDDGGALIDASLVDGLLAIGASGFPTVTFHRRSAGAASTDDGCFDFAVQSTVTLPVEIPGLVSCSGPEDCPEGQDCLADLTCG